MASCNDPQVVTSQPSYYFLKKYLMYYKTKFSQSLQSRNKINIINLLTQTLDVWQRDSFPICTSTPAPILHLPKQKQSTRE